MFKEPPSDTQAGGASTSSTTPQSNKNRPNGRWWRRNRPPERVQPLPDQQAPPATWATAPVQVEQLTRLYAHAQRTMWGGGLAYAKQLIVEGLTAANKVLGISPTSEANQQAALTILNTRTAEAASYIHRQEQENARRRYVRGLAVGVWASIGLLVAIMVIAKPFILWFIGLRSSTPVDNLPPGEFYALRDVLVCLGGGAAGAAVSVLLRLRREDLTYETVNNGAAIYRIMLGWFFAAAVLFLIKGGLVTIFETPDDNSVSSWFFWGAVGFLAGFNERWATGLISREPQASADTREHQSPASPPPVLPEPNPEPKSTATAQAVTK